MRDEKLLYALAFVIGAFESNIMCYYFKEFHIHYIISLLLYLSVTSITSKLLANLFIYEHD